MEFNIRYPGYVEDLQMLIRELGSMEKIDEYQTYLRGKNIATDESNPEKAEAAGNIISGLSSWRTMIRKAGTLNEMLPELKRRLEENPNAIDEQIDTAGQLAEGLFKGIAKSLPLLKKALDEFNRLDEYNTLHDDTKFQEIYQAIQGSATLSARKEAMDVKENHYLASREVFAFEEKEEELLQEMEDLQEQDGIMDPEALNERLKKEEADLKDWQNKEEELKSEKTKEHYRERYEFNVKEINKQKDLLLKLKEEEQSNDNYLNYLLEIQKTLADKEEDEKSDLEYIQEKQKIKEAAQPEFEKAKKERQEAEGALSHANENVELVKKYGGSAAQYYEKALNLQRWKKTREAFKGFVEKYKENNFVLFGLFAHNKDSMQKLFFTNTQIKAQVLEAKKDLTEVQSWCPKPEIFKDVENNKDIGRYMEKLLSDVDKEIEDAQTLIENDPVYGYTKAINSIKKQAEEINADTSRSKEERAELTKMLEQQMLVVGEKMKGENLQASDMIDHEVDIWLNGSKELILKKQAELEKFEEIADADMFIRFAEGRIENLRFEIFRKVDPGMRELKMKLDRNEIDRKEYDEIMENTKKEVKNRSLASLTELLQKEIEACREQKQKVFPEKEIQIKEKIFMAEGRRDMFSESSLREDIKKAENRRIESENRVQTLKERKSKTNRIYDNWANLRRERSRIYEEYAGKLENASFYDSLKKMIDDYRDNYHSAMKKGHKDSTEYKAIGTKLSALMSMGKATPLSEAREAISELGRIAREYIRLKNQQWAPFPSRQRIFRLNYAKTIVTFCENQLAMMDPVSMDAGSRTKNFMTKTKHLKDRKRLESVSKIQFYNNYKVNLNEMKQTGINTVADQERPLIAKNEPHLEEQPRIMNPGHVQKERNILEG